MREAKKKKKKKKNRARSSSSRLGRRLAAAVGQSCRGSSQLAAWGGLGLLIIRDEELRNVCLLASTLVQRIPPPCIVCSCRRQAHNPCHRLCSMNHVIFYTLTQHPAGRTLMTVLMTPQDACKYTCTRLHVLGHTSEKNISVRAERCHEHTPRPRQEICIPRQLHFVYPPE
jgi:hypothetical protein